LQLAAFDRVGFAALLTCSFQRRGRPMTDAAVHVSKLCTQNAACTPQARSTGPQDIAGARPAANLTMN